MSQNTRTKYYFASDTHFGTPTKEISFKRELLFIKWLDEIKDDAKEIFLLGDLFDYWFEYKTVVPRGFVRLLGKLAELTDSGIIIHFFKGNHDMWAFNYLNEECGIIIHSDNYKVEIGGKSFFMGHGDGLGQGDRGYKLLRRMFTSKFLIWSYARLHPNFGNGFAKYLSRKSRAATGQNDNKYNGDEKEYLVQYIKEKQKTEHHDYYIFGHRHLVIDMEIDGARYVNLGDWLQYNSFGKFDPENGEFEIKRY